jgi:protocatechuate 3,4-dioxygenase beta subunit
MKIAGEDEKGSRMIIKGRLMKGDDKTPYPGVIMYAYHTNSEGIYPKKGNEKGNFKWQGYPHGWCKTDEEGKYEIHSIKPGNYPSSNTPAHVHCVLKLPDGSMKYINDIVFEGDPFIDQNYLSNMRESGDNGLVSLVENGDGVLVGERERVTVVDESVK